MVLWVLLVYEFVGVLILWVDGFVGLLAMCLWAYWVYGFYWFMGLWGLWVRWFMCAMGL